MSGEHLHIGFIDVHLEFGSVRLLVEVPDEIVAQASLYERIRKQTASI